MHCVQIASLRWGPRAVATRTFTPSEANSALARVRPLAERMVAVRARLRELEGEQREVVKIIAGNGERLRGRRGAHAGVLAAGRRARGRASTGWTSSGVEVKDAETGLLDFPALREGEEVLLCWRAGEDARRVVARPRGGIRRPEADRLGRMSAAG